MTNITDKLKAKIIRDYNATHSILRASKRSGVGKVLARRVLVEAGVQLDGLELHYRHTRKLPDYMELRKEYEAGAGLNALASKYSAKVVTVRQALLKVGTQMRPQGNTVKPFTEEEAARVVALFEKLQSQEAVARELDTTQPRVSRYLRMAGIFSGEKFRGPVHKSWKGGRVKVGRYVGLLLSFTDPLRCMAQNNGYAMEHRVVMARHLGRPLEKHETVHHVNGVTTDNRIENLQLRNGRHGKGVVHRCRDCGSTNIESTRINE